MAVAINVRCQRSSIGNGIVRHRFRRKIATGACAEKQADGFKLRCRIGIHYDEVEFSVGVDVVLGKKGW